jgi:tRNAThr (cytosine32-N3)-methyltransferase
MATDPLDRARAALDAAHAADPERDGDRPAELSYADGIEAWIAKLSAAPSAALRIAARAQHLERWVIPRAQFPMDRPGYHRWRRAVQERQGQRADDLLRAAGCDVTLAARVAVLVSKRAPTSDPEAQALEDAACLQFLACELEPFAGEHPDYTRDKFLDILRRTWGKMSPRARELALAIPLPAALQALVREVAKAP